MNVLTLMRVSTDSQDVSRQRAEAKHNYAKHGLTSIGTYEIQGVSGTATLTDKQVMAVLERLKETGVDGVAMSALDRLFRPALRFSHMGILAKFIDAKKVLFTNKEGRIDPSTPEGKAICWSAAAQASAEWHETRRRSVSGKHLLLDTGFSDCSQVPYGYRYIPKFAAENARQIVIDDSPTEVPGITRPDVIRMIFEWRRDGLSRRQIVLKLNLMGIKSPGQKRRRVADRPGILWMRQTILKILRNRTYIGEYHRGGRIIHCPAIVSKSLFDTVAAMHAELAMKWMGRPSSKFLLRGYLWCGRCGRRYNGNQQCYRCSNVADNPNVPSCSGYGQINQKQIENAVFSTIWKALSDPAQLHRSATKLIDATINAGVDKKVKREIERLRDEIENAQQMGFKRAATPERVAREVQAREAEIARLERLSGATVETVRLPALKQVEAIVREITEGPMPTTYEARRPVLDSLRDLRIVYNAAAVEISASIPVAPEPKKCKQRQCAVSGRP